MIAQTPVKATVQQGLCAGTGNRLAEGRKLGVCLAVALKRNDRKSGGLCKKPHSESKGDAARIAMLRLVSPVAWQHINFYGRYEFNKKSEFIDMKGILHQLIQIPLG
jgi:hypothetical protein